MVGLAIEVEGLRLNDFLPINMMEFASDFLVPSTWEVEVSVAMAVFVIAAYWFLTWSNGEEKYDRCSAAESADSVNKVKYLMII